MEIIISLEPLRIQVLRNKFKSSTQIDCECSFCVRCSDEDHCTARRMDTLQENGFDAVLLLVALEKRTKVIVPHLADEGSIHAEDGCAAYGVGRRTTCHELDSERFQGLPYLVSRLHIHMLHAAFREFELFQESIIRKHCQDVCKGVSYS